MSENVLTGFSVGDQLSEYPDFLSSHDLVALGLFPSPDAVYFARMRGNSPDFIKLGRKVIYPKTSVVKFITEKMILGSKAEEEKQVFAISTPKKSERLKTLVATLRFKNERLCALNAKNNIEIKENERRIAQILKEIE